MSEWRVDGQERLYRGDDWRIPMSEVAAYLNDLEQYKALADHVAEPLRAFVPVTASQPDIDAFREPWLKDYDALKAQEAGQ